MRWLVLFAALSALVVGGCGSSSSAKPSAPPSTTTSPEPGAQPSLSKPKPKPPRIFTKKELAELALKPKDAPADLGYVRDESGRKTLEQVGLILPRQVNELRSYGFRAVEDAVFAANSRLSDRRVAERVWLMKNASSASAWLARSQDDSTGLGFTPLTPSGLGDESWAANGQAQGGVVITHAFRLGNAVFLVTSYSSREALSPAAARAAAAAALARARKV